MSKDKDNLSLHKGNLGAFRQAYHECEGDTFMFEGREMDKRYAMYALQYWDSEQERVDKAIRNN
jgi:hypothetical protein